MPGLDEGRIVSGMSSTSTLSSSELGRSSSPARWDALLYHNQQVTESFGRTVAEAMRGGCVPIVDAQGGFLEQITSGDNGFVCRQMDDFHLALKRILDPCERWKLSKNAMRFADERYSLANFSSRFERLLTTHCETETRLTGLTSGVRVSQ
ncbi:glycosyltransferase [Planctomicrobium sp. SH668]|uniref:glycosyltransferase n=1 Tax=Planctomicrobium sp. SH668 TaxID=3448126 RepID=UPI003F5B6280